MISRKKLRAAFGLSEPIESDAITRAIAKANEGHYTDAPRATKVEVTELVITTKSDIAGNEKHKPSPTTLDRFKKMLKE